MLNKKVRFFLFFYFPILLWMGIIFYLSSISGLSSGSESILVEVILRKTAHLTEYAILAFLIWRLFFSGLDYSFLKSSWLVLFIGLIYSAGDELHQVFVDNRSGQAIDVLIDLIGMGVGLLLVQAIYYLINKNKNNHDIA